jgi:hypothetical protein
VESPEQKIKFKNLLDYPQYKKIKPPKVHKAEFIILNSLQFSVSYPTPVFFYERILKVMGHNNNK